MSIDLALDCRIRVESYLPAQGHRPAPKLWLIEYVGSDWPKDHIESILLRDEDYQRIAKPRKGKWLPRNVRVLLPENIPVEVRIFRYAERYLRHYFEGRWDPGYDFSWTLDPKRYISRGDFHNLYMGMPGDDGYLRHLDGTILSRKVDCEFWELSYHTTDLAASLKKHRKWSDIRFEDNTCTPNWSIVGRHYLRAKYVPDLDELQELATRPNQRYPLTDIGGSYGVIHDRAEVRKHARVDKMRDKGYDDFDDGGLFDDDDDWC